MDKEHLKILVEVLAERLAKKNKIQKNKISKNKIQKNKTRKPKKLREEDKENLG